MKNRTILGYDFEWDDSNGMFQCRGEICYDDEHDEIPEAKLWQAANVLEKTLKDEGFNAECSHSEKGWVEVQIHKN